MTGRGLAAASAPVRPASAPAPAAPDRPRAMAAVRELLTALGEDADRPGLTRTPERVADLLAGLFAGVGADPESALGAPIPLEDTAETGDLVGMTAIPFRSLCEHHLLPFDGVVDVYFLPRARLAGFSRIVRLVETVSHRPQLQERLGQQIAHALMSVLDPIGVIVRVEAAHGCVAHLEPQAATARAVTVTTLGSIPDAAWRLTGGAAAD